MLRLLSAVLLLALILIFSVFAIANREIVVVGFDFWNLTSGTVDSEGLRSSPFLFEVPLYLVVFIAGLLGLFIGMLLPFLGFVRRTRLQLKKKLEKPVAAPPAREPSPPPTHLQQ